MVVVSTTSGATLVIGLLAMDVGGTCTAADGAYEAGIETVEGDVAS